AALGAAGSLWAQEEGNASQERSTSKAKEEQKPQEPTSNASQLTDAERATLVGILAKAGAEDATLKVVERTAARQARVMYALAKEDIEHARDMYCPAGDAVLERFDPKQGEAANVARMEEELLK